MSQHQLILRGASAALLALTAGCASIKSTNDISQGGFSYYLPKRMVKVSVVRGPTKTMKDLTAAAVADSAASTAKDEAEADLKEATDLLKASKEQKNASAKKIEELSDSVALAAAKLELATEAQLKTGLSLKTANNAYLAAQSNETPLYADTITVTALAPVADESQGYTASLHHNALRHDTWTLKTNAAGLLSNSDVKMEDQTGAIIVAIAQTVAALTSPGGIGISSYKVLKTQQEDPKLAGKKEEKQTVPRPINCGHGMSRIDQYESGGTDEKNVTPRQPFTMEMTLDPFGNAPGGSGKQREQSSWSYLESALCARGADYRFEFAGFEKSSSSSNSPAGNGLYFRRELPYLLTVESGRRGAPPTPGASKRTGMDGTDFYTTGSAGSFQLALPNASPPQLLTVKGGFMTTATNTSEFDNGMLLSQARDQPSEVLEVVSLPLKVISAVFEGPAKILSLKVDYTNKQADLANAQKSLVDATKALDDARKPQTTDDTSTGSTDTTP